MELGVSTGEMGGLTVNRRCAKARLSASRIGICCCGWIRSVASTLSSPASHAQEQVSACRQLSAPAL